jgi:DNA-directed RNA polymerase specialized sigma24 family protein
MTWYADALRRLGFSGRIRILFHVGKKGSAHVLIISGEKDVCEFYKLLNARENLRLDRKWCGLEARIDRRERKAKERSALSDEIVDEYNHGRTVRDLAREFSMSSGRLRQMLLKSGAIVKRRSSPTRVKPETEDSIVSDYRLGLTQREIAEKFGLTRPRISTILSKHRVETIPSHVRRLTDDVKSAAIAQAYRDGLSQAEVAKKFGISVSGVHKVLKRLRVTMRPAVRYRRKNGGELS